MLRLYYWEFLVSLTCLMRGRRVIGSGKVEPLCIGSRTSAGLHVSWGGLSISRVELRCPVWEKAADTLPALEKSALPETQRAPFVYQVLTQRLRSSFRLSPLLISPPVDHMS